MKAVPNPYTTGSSVSGPDHYGRKELTETLLRGGSRTYWLTGGRRVGKTSLLRQLEWLALRRGRAVPLCWDLDGCTTPSALGVRLGEAVADALPRLEPLGIPSTLPADADALAAITQLRRLLLRKGRELLLLCDDADAFVDLARTEPEFMQRLQREFSGAGLRTVVVSGGAGLLLHEVCAGWSSRPFLSGFEMLETLGVLDAASARALILRSQSPRGQRVQASAAVVAAVRDATGCHPYLLQKLCARLWTDAGSLRMPDAADLLIDGGLSGYLEHDWRTLTGTEQTALLAVGERVRAAVTSLQADLGSDPAALRTTLAGLEYKGWLRQLSGSYALGNAFLERWLASERNRLSRLPASRPSADTVRAASGDSGLAALAEQLNNRRARLAELELVRAKDFDLTPPQVLAEIAQLETEIAALRSLVVRRASA